ncbi:MAG: MBL fold metallo-hydrolase [Candidatus Eremiobacteraeota bacterium]|nr:MBL fold metallo-hydrolase [Candidatus Eremiobacteraeota bacterium]
MNFLRALCCVLLTTLICHAVPPQATSESVDFYRFQLGDFQITALLDGTKPRNPTEIAAQPERVKKQLKRHRIDSSTVASYNAFLIHTGSHLVLVDSGNGESLVESLRASGYRPEQIDIVLITHFHPDHIKGLTKDGNLVFLNADVQCDKRESDFWLSEEEERKAPESLKERFALIQRTMAPVVEAARLKPFESSGRLLDGIKAIGAPGHSPGHTAYLVESGDKGLLLWGDTVHIEQAQFAEPELTVKFDYDQQRAAESRLNLLRTADERGLLIASPHISFPGLGHVLKDQTGYRWIPLPYGTDF